MASYLPTHEGFLPYWLLFISLVSIQNTLQCLFTTKFAHRVYQGSTATQITPLSARTYGTWTLLSGVIRLYAAYSIDDQNLYSLALWTYIIALAHFGSEWLVFGTMTFGTGLLSPLIPALTSVIWMLAQWGFYVK